MPGPRAVAFAKRLSTTALQIEHQDSAAILMELKQILRVSLPQNIYRINKYLVISFSIFFVSMSLVAAKCKYFV